MISISDEQIEQGLSPYGVSVNPEACSQIRTYISLLLRWNKAVSLTTIAEPDAILKFHFGESLYAISAVPMRSGRLADVGSGAGFPGLPLAMVVPELRVTLIESSLKKCAFLAEVGRAIGVSNAEISKTRMEDITADVAPFDFITARALGQFDELLRWARRSLRPLGQVVLWLGESDADIISRKSGWRWQERALLPGSTRRYILVGSPER